MYRIGIDLGGTNIAAGLVDEQHRIVARCSLPTGAERPAAEVVADMARAAERRNLPLETAEVLPGGEMPEPSPILSAVQALPAKYSAVIHLYYYEGYSIKEISKLLQIPLPTVGTRLSRGRERLRQLLKEDVE